MQFNVKDFFGYDRMIKKISKWAFDLEIALFYIISDCSMS